MTLRPYTSLAPGLLLLAGLGACTGLEHESSPKTAAAPPSTLVDPFIGTGGHGHTYPGAVLPFGMVQLSPDNGTQGWDWSSGYHYSDSLIAGFSHTHLSGTGIGDLYDISLMPYYAADLQQGERQRFQHGREAASPGLYRVQLDNGIEVALTATRRVGLHQYRFPEDSAKTLAIDLGFHINWDAPTDTYIRVVNDTLLTGYRKSTGWAKDQWVFFAAHFSQPLSSHRLQQEGSAASTGEARGQKVRALLQFGAGPEPLLIKVGISSASEAGALANIQQEAPGWNFQQWVQQAHESWNAELGKIQARLISPALDTVFYTALYHTALAPSLFSDVKGQYKGANHQLQTTEGFERYSVFSLWDTFRAAHPLYTITQGERLNDFFSSLMAFYHEYELLPVWALAGNETNTMTGYHAVPVLAEALLKGHLQGREEEVYQAMLASAEQNIRGTDLYRQWGYIPADKDGWSVTKTLEYAFDDWAIAQVAKKLGKQQDYETFMKRSASYKPLFDRETLFMRGKNSDGSWVSPFDPFHSEHGFEGMYIEGTAWQHSWFVPHDVQGLISLFGSPARFEQHLDSTFQVTSQMTGDNVSIDITGLIGQYAHGNEPSHHIAYLYNYVGKAWKTQARVRNIMENMYTTGPEGLAGNDDCGQMSAWYVFSALGFYPVNPVDGHYVLGSPLVREAQLQLPEGKSFRITAENNSSSHVYVQDVFLNGKRLERSYITHEEIMQGGALRFVMGLEPNKSWASERAHFPPSGTN
ncbi:GH92 family glycosyl hydrolase [Cesiribacter andamanensis]|uniref:Putative alpha-1,2-mannosidase n=1 Tax=Cesiribacter andamanensis AMV16 TaxID=1279009 RepID=M7N1J7_9BACT|nr:GH92 family glycosyl hydrolase [Cesiribacter andamanensis]EMR02558.1 Putative alpha-1,2-mannosidase [Cesiribacter andamanensis AMV16]